ncbi:transmembrane protein 161AB protein [Tasmannia lanceolata]|uniref:transmembrane protein 161AB protein n=1 Tax=Tasmannia lanceolata TaxID=3420 RepID=UPI0040631345
MMISILISYKNLIIHAILSLFITLILTTFSIPIRFLEGLHTYIHPENLGQQNRPQGNPKAVIRRPENPNNGNSTENLQNPSSKRGNRSKDKVEFDESNAQIFRMRLVNSHLRSRLYFTAYQNTFVYSIIALLNFLLNYFLPVSESDSTIFANGAVFPIVLGFVAFSRLSFFLGKLAFERSSSKRSEKQLSILFGVLGFLLVLSIFFVLSSNIFDFEFDSSYGVLNILMAFFAGCIAGFMFIPAAKNARAFWLGTDQLRWNLSVISCGKVSQILLYVNILMTVFTSLLWINPVAEIFVKKTDFATCGVNLNQRKGLEYNGKLAGNVGMVRSDYMKFRLCSLLVSALLELLTLRPKLQMYLNESVLSWYQRLHASKVPDLDFSRAKIFLHNYYLCLVVLQFLAPPTLVLLFLGFSQIQGNLFGDFPFIHSFEHCSSYVKEAALFMAWWVVFVWAIFTSSSLALYRCGFAFIS